MVDRRCGLTWTVKRRIAVLGAPVLLITHTEGHEVSIGRFDYPDGRCKVRVEIKSDHGIFRAAALATRIVDATRARMIALENGGDGHAITVKRERANDSMLVDVDGPQAIDIVLPYFGDDIARAWNA